LVVLPVVVTLALVAALGVVRLGVTAAQRGEVQAAADAAALAGAADGRAGAAALAHANDTVLVAFAERGPLVRVEVVRGSLRASATAERYRPSPTAR
jgi:uncharacterized membrane protein